MNARFVRRTALSAVACLSLVVVSSIVGGAPVYGTGTFSLPGVGSMAPVWTGNSGCPRSASSVAMTTGKAVVQGLSGGVVYDFGQVPAGYTLILEGQHDLVRAIAQMANTYGTYTNRFPSDMADVGPDWTVGSGSANFTLANQHYAFYGAMEAYPRIAVVKSNAYTANVTDGVATTVLADLDAGDSTFCAMTTDRFGAKNTGTGANRVDYTIFNTVSHAGPFTATATAQAANDTDRAHADGTIDLSVVVSVPANVQGTVAVTSTLVGQAPVTTTLDANHLSTTISGLLVGDLTWTSTDAGTVVTLTVSMN